ncbi:MAG: MarR family transcriptional regulator [Nannocystaceae bacterium]
MGNYLQMERTTQLALVLDAIASLQRLTELFHRRRVELARAVGITEQQWSVLEEISTEHFMPSLFAKARESTAAAVSKILRQLLDKGLVRVSISSNDGRQREYGLTASGRSTMSRLRRARQRAIDAVWMQLDEVELRRFVGTGSVIANSIEAYAAITAGRT